MQTISSQLYGPIPYRDPLLSVLLTVTVVDSNGNYAFSKYSNERGDFYRINPDSHVVIRYTPKDKPWERNHQVIITQKNIYQLRLGFKKFYRIFQRDDLYRYDNQGKITEVVTDERDVVIINLGMGQLLRFIPTITTDRHNISYPGVNVTINREENTVDLSIDEFEGMMDLFEHIDIYQLGLSIMQCYIGMKKVSVEDTIKEIEKQKPPTNNTTNKFGFGRSLFGNALEKEYVKAPPPEVKKPETLDDL